MKKPFKLLVFLIAGIWTGANGQTVNHWETVVYNNDTWRCFVGVSEPDSGRMQISFADSSWSQGPGGFGYGFELNSLTHI